MTPEQHQQLRAFANAWCGLDGHQASGKQCGDALLFFLDANPAVPAVPVSELRAWLRRGWVNGEFEALLAKYTPRPSLPPSTEKPGTYLWAREEAARGKRVGRLRRASSIGIFDVVYDPGSQAGVWDKFKWTHDDFIATDWEVVP